MCGYCIAYSPQVDPKKSNNFKLVFVLCFIIWIISIVMYAICTKIQLRFHFKD